jgi:uncharacterized protein (DUF2267 family)
MSAHHDFDQAVHEGNLWLHKVDERLHFQEGDRHAYSALRATLHALRDRLTPQAAVQLSAQLPMVLRGLFFEGWKMGHTPSDEDTVDEFCGHIERELPPKFPMDGKTVAAGVFEVLRSQLDAGEIAKVIDQLPRPLKALWPSVARHG